jgi:hypothetical protein
VMSGLKSIATNPMNTATNGQFDEKFALKRRAVTHSTTRQRPVRAK